MKFHYFGQPRTLDEDNGEPEDSEYDDHAKNLELVEMIVQKSLDFDVDLNIIDEYSQDRNVVFQFAFKNG